MTKRKYAAITGFMGKIQDRFMQYGDIFEKMNSGADAFEMMDYVRKFLKCR